MSSSKYIFSTVSLTLLLLFANATYCQDYIAVAKAEVTNAKTTIQKIAAYEKWLPLSILVHDANAKNDLASFYQLAQKEDNTLAIGIYHLNLAYYTTESIGDYNLAFTYCIKAKDIFESINAQPQLVATYNRLAFIVLWNEIARKKPVVVADIYNQYLGKALQISKRLKNKNLEIQTLSFIGSYFNVTEKNNQKALSYFFEAEKKVDATVTPDNRLAILESIAIVFAETGSEEKALEYESKAIKESFFNSYGYGKSNMYRSFASMYLKNKNFDKALHYANIAFAISKEMNAPEFISRGAERLYEIYKAMGNDKMALQFHETNKITEDSLSRERFENTFTQYDVAKKEALIATQRLELLKKNTYVIGGLILTAIAVITTLLAFKKYRAKQRLQMEQTVDAERKNAHARLIAAEEKERKRIAAELHDNMGVLANAILHNSNQLNAADTEKKILVNNLQQNAKDILSTLRETVWALKANEVTYTETWLRIINFINQAKRNFTDIKFETQGQTSESLLMPSVKALHIVMVIKEVITNAVKHASATTVSINSSLANSKWQIQIEDNGAGFDKNEFINTTEHNGLINMQERAAAGNFKFDIQSVIGKGTSVFIEI
jgi:signal transduction histidine kinase